MRDFTLSNVRILSAAGTTTETTLAIEDGQVAAIGGRAGLHKNTTCSGTPPQYKSANALLARSLRVLGFQGLAPGRRSLGWFLTLPIILPILIRENRLGSKLIFHERCERFI